MHTNQRLFVEELQRRGAVVSTIDESVELVEVSYKGRSEYLMDRAGKSLSYLSATLAADKHLSKHVLSKVGIGVPEGALFAASQIQEALEYGQSLGYPLVVKPNVGSHGDGVRSGISSFGQLEAAIRSLACEAGSRSHFVVERHVPGSEFRIFVTSLGGFAALLREPASVVGDGSSTVADLARAESMRRQEEKAERGSSLCPIALDQVALGHLRAQGLGFDHVPGAGVKVQMRLSSNLAQGGSSQDMTEAMHPSALAIAKRALAAFEGLPCLGIDFICRDLSEPVGPANPYAIIEVNANPGLAMHHMPAIGKPRDVASLLADALFPEL